MEQDIDTLLNDPSKRAMIIQRLQSGTVSHLTPSGMVGGSESLTPGGMPLHPSGMFPTTSEMFPPPNGAFAWPHTWYPFPPVPLALLLHQGADKNATPLQQVDATRLTATQEKTESRPIEIEDRDADCESDEISILGADQFQDFNPRLEQDKSWTPPAAMLRFLEEHLNLTRNARPS